MNDVRDNSSLMPSDRHGDLEISSGADVLLDNIREEWRSKSLIQRVKRLLPVDASSACQRIFNASIHDIRQKIVFAGIDLAKKAASLYKLPPVSTEDDVLESYSTSNIIDLSYRMGLLTRPEWRRLQRCYGIRKDLEHEDDQYEAEPEDIFYVFRTCVEVVLAVDPIELLRVSDVKELIEAPGKVIPSEEFIEDYEKAPTPRQKEIMLHLINTSLNDKSADITRQNAIEVLRRISVITKDEVKIEIAKEIQERIKRSNITLGLAKVSHAAGVMAYLKQRKVNLFFTEYSKEMNRVSYRWTEYGKHGKLLDDLEDVGGLKYVSKEPLKEILRWLVLAYIGQPGGYGQYGRKRMVFYSDTAAPRIEKMMRMDSKEIKELFEEISKEDKVKRRTENKYIARRLENLRDIIYK